MEFREYLLTLINIFQKNRIDDSGDKNRSIRKNKKNKIVKI